MAKNRILWIDDEIMTEFSVMVRVLETHYEVFTAVSGDEGLEIFRQTPCDCVILDHEMVGMSGIDVLKELKGVRRHVPVVMLTKNPEFATYKSAHGYGVDKFVRKPVDPEQLMFDIDNLIEPNKVRSETVMRESGQLCAKLMGRIDECRTFADWAQLYRQIIDKELEAVELDLSDTASSFAQVREAANSTFAKRVKDNYENWFSDKPNDTKPEIFSHQILSQMVKPLLKNNEKVALVVIDNFRLDQWLLCASELSSDFNIKTDLYCSILPAATQFSRNAIFSGLLPSMIKKLHPEFWVQSDKSEESLNKFERELLQDYFDRQKLNKKCSYYKVGLGEESASNYIKKFNGYKNNDLNAVVFSFVDALSHKASEDNVAKQLAQSDAAYRDVTRSWFKFSQLKDILDLFKDNGYKIILTTDHGTIRVSKPVTISGTRDINSNYRFKVDKNLIIDNKDLKKLLLIDKPETVGLTTSSPSDKYVFATNDDFFVYPNNKNEFVGQFEGSLQHGGISLEEMVLPLVTLTKK